MHDVKMSLVINFVLHGLCFEVARALVHDVKMSFVINFVLCGLCCEVTRALVHDVKISRYKLCIAWFVL